MNHHNHTLEEDLFMANAALLAAATAIGQLIAQNGGADIKNHLATVDAHLSSIDAKQVADEAKESTDAQASADTLAVFQALLDAAQGKTSGAGGSSGAGSSSAGGSSAGSSSTGGGATPVSAKKK